jgi:putative DNA primase/helicase
VSGKGVHIICAGELEGFKDDAIGLEVYCGSQYFICTGKRWEGTPAEVQPADPEVMAYLRELVKESKDRQDDEKRRARAAAVAAAPARAPAPPSRAGEDDFRRINDVALQALHQWVPVMLPKARSYMVGTQPGYRISSKELGRDLQEDLQFSPDGIMDFGEERGYSPIDAVIKWLPSCGTPKAALQWLAERLNVSLSTRRSRRETTPSGGAALDERPEPPPLGEEAPPEKKATRIPRPGPGKGKRIPKDQSALVDALTERFALVYGTESVWDRLDFALIKVSAMRLAFGRPAVNMWLARPSRVMVRTIDLVFEPGHDVPDPQINMWGGLELEPVPCTAEDVKPMLRLLRHLCSESIMVRRVTEDESEGDGTADDVDAVMHWILSWQALPLQKPGTKMQTACVFHGAQGTGKNLYWDVWRDMFGVYGITVGQVELEDKFNGWVSRKLAIVGDEVVSRQEMYHNKNRLKLVVTQHKRFPIRDIQQSTRWESNYANVVFLSNESTPLALEERDRRYMVVYTPLEADEGLYQSVRDFLANDGAAKWLHYLLQYTTDDFDAHTKPLMTKAKEDLIQASWRPPVRFGFEWLEGYLDLPVQVCSAEQLYRAFRRWCDQTGQRWPASQSEFTEQLGRWVRERVKRETDGRFEEPRLVYKQIALKDPSSKRKTVRCWLPRGTSPLPGVSEGAWAWESVDCFEAEVRKFCRSSRGGRDDDGGEGAP